MMQVQNEITATQKAIYSVTGVMSVLFRPPGGFLNQTVINVSKQAGDKMIMWSWDEDSPDWSKPGINKIVSRVLNNAHNGDIILFHDHTGGHSQTIGALPTAEGALLMASTQTSRYTPLIVWCLVSVEQVSP